MAHDKVRMVLKPAYARPVAHVVKFHRLAQMEHVLALPDLGNVLAWNAYEHNDCHGRQRQQRGVSSS